MPHIIFARQMPGKVFLIVSAFMLMLAAAVLLAYPGGETTLWANQLHSVNGDYFFGFISWTAEWLLITLSLIWGLYLNKKTGLWFAFCFLLELGLNQGLKAGINAGRPVTEYGRQLHAAEGHPLSSRKSFPSGHTAAAFTALGFFALTTRKAGIQASLAVFATMAGFSRMYLGQHYMRDVAGGICVALLILLLFIAGVRKWNLELFLNTRKS